MAGFYDPPSFFLRPYYYYNLPCPVGATGGFCGHLASSNSRVVQHPMLQAKVVDALTANSAALVLRRTGWVSTVRRIVIQVIVGLSRRRRSPAKIGPPGPSGGCRIWSRLAVRGPTLLFSKGFII